MGRDAAGPANVLAQQNFSFDPTAASATTNIVIPQGAVIEMFLLDGGGTGGVTPTVAIGISGDNDLYVNDAAADSANIVQIGGTAVGTGLTGTALAADTTLWAGAGDTGTDATGGTVRCSVVYWIDPATTKDPSSE
jgi:hypothetical protein